MGRYISLILLILSVIFATSNGCELEGRCRGGCRRSFKGRVRPIACDLECPEVKCVNKCPKPKVCTANYKCAKRCAWKYDAELKKTFVRCWCVNIGTCGKCDCKKKRVFPWDRVQFKPFDEEA